MMSNTPVEKTEMLPVSNQKDHCGTSGSDNTHLEPKEEPTTMASPAIEKKHTNHEQLSQPQDLTLTPSYDKTSSTRKTILMISIVLTQLVQLIQFGGGLVCAYSISTSLHNHNPYSTQIIAPEAYPSISADASWIAASYTLTQGTFVLLGGRLGAVYGHKFVLTLGCAWWVVWTLAIGYTDNIVGFCATRALSGIGAGISIPNAVALLGINFPPGRQRNVAIALFGAMSPVGAAGGSVVSGLIVQLTQWKWLFFFLGLLGVVVFSIATLSIPTDEPQDPTGDVDYLGAYLGVAGLILFNFVWNQAPAVGWQTVYVYVLLIAAILHLAIFVLWEAKFAKSPILPFSIWKAPSFAPLMLIIFIAFMSMGIFFYYQMVMMLNIHHASLVLTGVQNLPVTIAGTAVAFLAAWMVPKFPAQVIIGVGCLASVACNVLLATTPADQIYWAQQFPAMLLSSFTLDLVFASAQIIASSSVARAHQGAAGSLVGTLLSYGMSTGLGFAGTVEVYTNDGGRDILQGYRGAAWLAAGFAGLAMIATLLFIRMPKTDKEGWDLDD